MKAEIRDTEVPLVGIRGEIGDMSERDPDGNAVTIGFQVSQEDGDKLAVYVMDEDGQPRVQVAFTLIDGRLYLDVIDYEGRSPGAQVCGADAEVSLEFPVLKPQAERDWL